MTEFQIWSLFTSGKIGIALTMIASILGIWLAMRIAVATRNSEETNIVAKIISSVFGLSVLAMAWRIGVEGATFYQNIANGLNRIGESGVALSPSATGFIEFVGLAEPSGQPGPIWMVFLAASLAIILVQIWMPKK